MSSKLKLILCGIVLASLMAGCALGEVSIATSLPPITLAAPPALQLVGTCEDTKTLENWLQITSELLSNFQTLMNTAAVKMGVLASGIDGQLIALLPNAKKSLY